MHKNVPDKLQDPEFSKKPSFADSFFNVIIFLLVPIHFLIRPFVKLAAFINGKMVMSKWRRLSFRATFSFNREDYDSAIDYTKQSLKLLERKFGTDNQYYVATLTNLGEYYRIKEDYITSEKILFDALEISEKGSYSYYAIHVVLGNLLADKQEYKKSEESYLTALEYFEKYYKTSDLYKTLTFGLHSLYTDMGQTEKASYYLEESH